jgi:hypothetical protein
MAFSLTVKARTWSNLFRELTLQNSYILIINTVETVEGVVMDLLLLELILWAGLLFFFWALKDGLERMESDLEAMGLAKKPFRAVHSSRYVQPESVAEPIGTYKDQPIYRYAYFNGQRYQFDCVLPPGGNQFLSPRERYLAPGLLYVWCDEHRPAVA